MVCSGQGDVCLAQQNDIVTTSPGNGDVAGWQFNTCNRLNNQADRGNCNRDNRVITGAGQNDVTLAAQEYPVIPAAVEAIIVRPDLERDIIARPGEDQIQQAAQNQEVVSVTGIHDVVRTQANKEVVTAGALQDVHIPDRNGKVITAAQDQEVARAQDDNVINATGANDDVTDIADTGDVGNAADAEPCDPVIAIAQNINVVIADELDFIISVTAPDKVGRANKLERVVAVTSNNGISKTICGDLVIAAAGLDDVCTPIGFDDVVAVTGNDDVTQIGDCPHEVGKGRAQRFFPVQRAIGCPERTANERVVAVVGRLNRRRGGKVQQAARPNAVVAITGNDKVGRAKGFDLVPGHGSVFRRNEILVGRVYDLPVNRQIQPGMTAALKEQKIDIIIARLGN